VGECFFWYRPTRVVPDQRPLNGRCCCCSHPKQLIPLAAIKTVTNGGPYRSISDSHKMTGFSKPYHTPLPASCTVSWTLRWCIKWCDITSLGSVCVQVVGLCDVAARLGADDGPITALVGGASCSIGSALQHRAFNDYKDNITE